jgi:2-C-methyl-D-erythritol 2,4-cyclodiphosphate synthase
MRVGIGYDIHALKRGRPLVLGGLIIPFSKGASGHSDGDVLLHAIVDAILGAMGEGDIGDHFPDTDNRYKNIKSEVFVRKIRQLLKKKRLCVEHLDSTLIAESPKMADYKLPIRRNVARLLNVALSNIGLKAKTREGFDAVGKNKAIECFAVVSLRKK